MSTGGKGDTVIQVLGVEHSSTTAFVKLDLFQTRLIIGLLVVMIGLLLVIIHMVWRADYYKG